MTLLKIIFWFCFFIIFYSYFGYGILVFFLVRIKHLFVPKNTADTGHLYEPEITLIVAAYNEEDFIEKKVRNTFALDYPPEKLQLIFITDGSTDRTPSLLEKHGRIQVLHQPERKGKVAAMNRAMHFAKTPLVIFSDANTLLNEECIREIARHYEDPSVGGVAGEKKIISDIGDQAAGVGEGLYWKYESFLKKMDAELYSVVGAAGELFSVRTALFRDIREDTIIEDFVLSLQVCMQGYIVQYEPGAYAMETPSASMKEEEKRKIRISAGAFQAMVILKGLFNIFRYPLLSFQFISHRILRWTACPLCLPLLFIANAALVIGNAGGLYLLIFALQVVFYVLAAAGWIYAHRNIRIKALYLPYYFLFMNLSVYLGFYRFIRKKQAVLWEKAARKQMA